MHLLRNPIFIGIMSGICLFLYFEISKGDMRIIESLVVGLIIWGIMKITKKSDTTEYIYNPVSQEMELVEDKEETPYVNISGIKLPSKEVLKSSI